MRRFYITLYALFLGSIIFTQGQSPILEVTTYSDIVTDSDDTVNATDVVVFTIKAKNISNLALSSLTISHTLAGINGSALTLNSSPTFFSNSNSSAAGSLAAGEIGTYIATYTFDAAGVSAGGISLTVTGTASTPGNSNNVIDPSDDGDDQDGNTINDPTQVIAGNTVTALEGTKLENYVDNDGNGTIGLGDQLEYIITVYNKGEEQLNAVTLFDVLKDQNNNVLALIAPFTPPGPIFVSSDQNSSNGNLLVGETVTYKAVYVVQQGAVDSGGLINCLDIQADGVSTSRRASDTADDGIDNDGNIEDDCTESTITTTATLEVTKTATVQDC